jgi:hypothetical protein
VARDDRGTGARSGSESDTPQDERAHHSAALIAAALASSDFAKFVAPLTAMMSLSFANQQAAKPPLKAKTESIAVMAISF